MAGSGTTQRRTRFLAGGLLLAVFLVGGCAAGDQTLAVTGGQTLPQEVTTEYLLTNAGFTRLAVSDETPQRQALQNSIPPGKLTTYSRDSEVYYVYSDGGNYLYIGDELAYQRYLAKGRGRQLCQRITGANNVQFWSCMQEYQERGK